MSDISSTLDYIRVEPEQRKDAVCPSCGYCPHCGHRPYEVRPYQPYYQPYEPRPGYWWYQNDPWATYATVTF